MRRALCVLVAALALTACSNTETLVHKDGVCYSRNIVRAFGAKLNTDQHQVDMKKCTESP